MGHKTFVYCCNKQSVYSLHAVPKPSCSLSLTILQCCMQLYGGHRVPERNPHCSYTASVQEMQEGTLRMHRKVTSGDVEDYASHVPKDKVELDKEEDIEYQKGILTRASGTVETKLMRKVL